VGRPSEVVLFQSKDGDEAGCRVHAPGPASPPRIGVSANRAKRPDQSAIFNSTCAPPRDKASPVEDPAAVRR